MGSAVPASERIYLSKADVTEVEEKYLLEALRSGWIAPLGPDVDAFEAEVAERVGVAGALALSSGTAALHLALLEIGARPGTVVLVPTMTFAATANAVAYTGAEPVFVDSQISDGNVDPGLLIEAVDSLRSDGADIAAVTTVDLFGRCADYRTILPAMRDRGIPVIEDAAEAIGSVTDQGAAGSFGRAAALSFNGNKIMTTSGGGMLLTDDLPLLDRCRYLSTQARQPVAHYEHTEIGFNYRLSNLLAALGRAQLSRLDGMIERRRAIRARYAAALLTVPGVTLLGEEGGSDDDNCWLTTMTVDPNVTGVDAHGLIESLNGIGIEARHLWKPMHRQPAFAGRTAFLTGSSDALFANGVALPSGSGLTDAQVDAVIDRLRLEFGKA